jgi:hypothetical protein
MPTGPLDRWDVVAKPGRARIRVARGRAGTKTLLRMPQIPVRCISDRRPTALQMTVACSRPKFRRLRPWWSPVRLAAICISHVLTLAASQNCCRALTRQLRQGFGLIHERGAAQAKMEDSWPVESDQRIEILDFSGAMLFGAIFLKIGVRRDAGLFSIRRCRPISMRSGLHTAVVTSRVVPHGAQV